MNRTIPKVAAIHDLSGLGRCSLTVVIPVLSSMGIQVCPLPTAILSTHSGGFGEFFFYDFTDNMEDYASHWESTEIGFDCIYSGFLGSEKQIDIVLKLFQKLKRHDSQCIVVDPVMGDHGKLYKTYTPIMQSRMRLLVEQADIITPNLTEACFLLEEPYVDEPMSVSTMKRYLKKLSEIGPDTVVITGIKFENNCFANIGYMRSLDSYWIIPYDRIPVQYPGTGDIFASVLTGSILQGEPLPTAMQRATQFVSMAVLTTYDCGAPAREGVLLEKVLGQLKGSPKGSNNQIIELE